MNRSEFINLISFCILMENGEGIMGKSPHYVLEKWSSRCPELLDDYNQDKLKRYVTLWVTSIQQMEL